ncbi:hypothetical protein PspS35_24925 [Pseudomonas sp. S35]|nr:hypothetical protein PspS35_24925 [Pseudomonas sp. S35]
MSGPISSTRMPQYPTANPPQPHDDAALQRKKRSIDAPQSQLEPHAHDGSSGSRRHRGGSGLDSLGKGNLL